MDDHTDLRRAVKYLVNMLDAYEENFGLEVTEDDRTDGNDVKHAKRMLVAELEGRIW